jgi:hypothetical protein
VSRSNVLLDNRTARVFKRSETVVSYLRERGVMEFAVDAAEYDPSALTSRKPLVKAVVSLSAFPKAQVGIRHL